MSVSPTEKRPLIAVADGKENASSSTSTRKMDTEKVEDEVEYDPELEFECRICGEQTLSKALKIPFKPTQKMIEDHSILHIPFRAWCPTHQRINFPSLGS